MSVLNFLIIFQCFLNFHGVYYQTLMEKLEKMDSAERDNFIQPIKGYRVYAKDYWIFVAIPLRLNEIWIKKNVILR